MAETPRPKILTAAALMTRPADTTAYASGDLVANSVTAGSVVPMSLAGARNVGYRSRIRRIGLLKSTASLTAADFRVHLFRDGAPTVAIGDNTAMGANPVSTNLDKYLGWIDVAFTTTPASVIAGAAGALAWSALSDIGYDALASANLYALLEARSAYAPGNAETFRLMAQVDQF